MVNHDRLEKINQQLKIMLWRVVTVRRRNLFTLLLQFAVPLFTSVLLVYRLSTLSDATSFNFTQVPAQTFPRPMLALGEIPPFFTILYAPTNNLSTSIMDFLKQTLQRKGYKPDIQSFPDEEALYEEYFNRTQVTSGITIAGIIFEGTGEDDNDFTYTIRSEMPPTIKAPFPIQNYNGPSFNAPYTSFAQLQTLLNIAYLERTIPHSSLNMDQLKIIGDTSVKWYRFPFPAYTPQDRRPIAELAPTALIFGFIIIYAIVIKRLATEKSNQIREMYLITGLIDWIYWFTHLVDNYSIFLVQAIVISLLYTIGLNGNGQDSVFKYTSLYMIFSILALWGLNFILSAFAFSIPFNRPIFALTVGIVFWVIQIVPGYFVDPLVNQSVDPLDTEMPRLISCLLPNMALTLAFHVISQKEMYGSGATLPGLFESTPLYGNLSIGIILICLIITSLFHIPLIYYLVNVVPTQYGISKPWLFPIYSLFQYKPKKEPKKTSDEGGERYETIDGYLEPLGPSDEVKISIRNTSKDFGSSARSVMAVDNVSLDVPHRQITMLLGENGAGKTTLMSMIIGLTPPTRGTVAVNGHDILEETSEARKSLSFCPQTNILQSDLTVEQHLILYGSIKGVQDSRLDSEVRKILGDIRLMDSKTKKPSQLSGGMCRRLNLGIALIGDTEVIVLDEPTSGLDPESRRAVWDILNEIKSQRTILMTTHFIEEADAVGDRIAIMRNGKLACFGSPMFLKKIFGTGYELRIAKNEESNLDDIVNVTRKYFPDAKLGYAVVGEVIFALPQELSDNSIFFRFFRELEEKKSDLKISSWGLSYTTLEDVFIRVISEQKRDSRSETTIKIPNGESKATGAIETDQVGSKQVLYRKVEMTSGFRLTYQRLGALLIKRVHYAKRYWKILLFQIIVPVMMFAIIMLLDLKIVNMTSSTDFEIDLKLEDIYGATKGFFTNLSSIDASQFGRNFQFAMAHDEVKIEFLNSSTSIDDHMLDKAATLSFYDYTHDYMVSMEWRDKELKVYFNGEATHGLPMAVDSFFEALYQNLTGSPLASSRFNVKNHPFPAKNDLLKPEIFITTRPRMWTIFLQMTMPFLAASYVLIPTHENSSKAKLLQLMTGLHPILYWLGHFLFDMTIHVICTGFIYGAVFSLNSQNIFTQDNMQLAFISSLLTSGLASIPMAYIFSFVFDRPSIGFSFLVMLYMVFGVTMSITDFILESYVPDQISQNSKDIFDRIIGLFPLHTMTTEIVRTLTISISSSVCGLIDEKILQAQCSKERPARDMIRRCCPNLCSKTGDCFSYRDPLSWKYGIIQGLIQLCCEACVFFTILLLLERFALLADLKRRVLCLVPYFRKNQQEDSKSNDQELQDSDVSAEEIRVRRNFSNPAKLSSLSLRKNYTGNTAQVVPGHHDILSVIDLKKRYGNHWAVQGLSFGVHQNECFGLLGVNGAGKSTTFKMLVGDIRPTDGNAYIDNYSLVDSKRKFQECIGYCPQYDALIDRLTGREMLYLFGRLRGMNETVIHEFSNRLIRDVDLGRHADNITSFYSGGNKRKLSLALALIGNPRVIFLDEPSSCVDAGNRRRMWSILSTLRENGCSLVLTSHSMEECETLCSRIAIMVNGKFRCLGSLQHLRHKFGQGYSLYIKIKSNKANDPGYLKELKETIEKKLGAELKQHHLVNLFYYIKGKSFTWSTLFQIMEEIKLSHQLEDYVISDTSLEQIFMDFARKQLSSD